MRLLQELWNDEAGAVYSAEAVLLGTVVLTGASVGISHVNTALNEELNDLSGAIRSLDQSYHLPGQTGRNGAASAGSTFLDGAASERQLPSSDRERQQDGRRGTWSPQSPPRRPLDRTAPSTSGWNDSV